MSGSTEPVPDDLEDIFGFKAAKERLEQGTKLTIQNPDNKNDASFIKHRVFMNCVDSFNSRYIAAVNQIYGASRIIGMDEAQGEEEANQNMEVIPQNKYEVIGTMQFGFHKPTEDILFTLSDEDEEKFHVELLKCGYIIYDITQNPDEIKKAINTLNFLEAEIEKIKEIGPKTFSRLEEERIFILISTVMTWGKTKPLNPRDPTLAYTESKYKKRKAHPNYEDHIACEREVVLRGRKDKDHLKTYVVCSGIVYGEEELDLTPIFKLAWLNESYLPCFYPGTNSVPLIHVGDLARVLHKLMDINPGTPQYILAVEPSPTSLKKILVALSKALGSGRTKNVSQAEAFLYNEFNQRFFDLCTLDIRMEPEFVSDALQVDWQTELNIAQNMKRIAEQFVIKRHLISKKIILHGPPASGKTRLAKMLAEKYGLHYISIATMIEDIVENLRNNIEDEQLRLEEARERAKEKEILEKDDEDEEIDEEEMEEEDVGGNIEEWEEQIREIRVVFKESPDQKIPDEMVIRLLRSYLLQNKCQYQGYVIDGYPKTYQQAERVWDIHRTSSLDPVRLSLIRRILDVQNTPIQAKPDWV
ncbi:unnamed protein product [Brassicogethes aeneus]|uniref:Hydin adenylate kinase-like domain-containing protein n=1 Tax=Brassicogethes aeneus TaxID=1431903 RepID=A0A9P0AWP5_BRAAE|nr:unnamed protein product [Brassicogethes aeneus]